MPLYQYECRNCEHNLEKSQGFNDSPLSECPKCGLATLFRVITGGLGFFTANRTVGMVCDKNNTCFSEDYKHHLANKNKTKKVDKLSDKLPNNTSIQKPNKIAKPWYKKNQTVSNEKLKSATQPQLEQYIETGKIK